MQYQASVAYRLESAERENLDLRPRFGVVEGGGLDAQARRGVSHSFWAKIKLVCATLFFVSVIAFVRVGITAATVSEMAGASELRSQIQDAEYAQSNLLIVKSTLSSSARIDRIATQNYGMVYPTSSDAISVNALQSDSYSQSAQN